MAEIRMESALREAFAILNRRGITDAELPFGQVKRSVKQYCAAARRHTLDFEPYFLRDVAELLAARQDLLTDDPQLGNEPVRAGRNRRMVPRDRAVGEEVARREIADQTSRRLIG